MHGIFPITAVIKPNKGETSAFAGKAVFGDVNIADISILFEYATQIVASSAISQIIDFQ